MFSRERYGNRKILIVCGSRLALKKVSELIKEKYKKEIQQQVNDIKDLIIFKNGYRIFLREDIDLKIQNHNFEQIILQKSTPLSIDIIYEVYKNTLKDSKRKDKVKYVNFEELNLDYLTFCGENEYINNK